MDSSGHDPRTGRLLDEQVTDGQWADIAAEHLHRIGLARQGDEQAVRWVAVRHADDHVHVVATLAGQTPAGCSRATTTTGRAGPA